MLSNIDMTPLKMAIKDITLKTVKKYKIAKNAPNTFIDLMDDFNKNGIITVYNGNTNNTIYNDDQVNLDFRAWHDHTHITHKLDFTLQSEYKTCDIQIAKLKKYNLSDILLKIFELDIKAQVKYYYTNKKYINNQFKFIDDVLMYGENYALNQAY